MITKINDFIKENKKAVAPAVTAPAVNESTEPATAETIAAAIAEAKTAFWAVISEKFPAIADSTLTTEQAGALEDAFNAACEIAVNQKLNPLDGTIEEGLGSIVSNIVNNDKKMGETLTKNLQTYINTKPKTLVATPEEMKAVFDLAAAAKFYTKDIKFADDNQKAIWEYLKTRASKSMHFGSSGNINPAS